MTDLTASTADPNNPLLATIRRDGQRTATAFGWVAGISAAWVFADIAYVPLKHVGAALYNQDALAAANTFGAVVAQALPTLALIIALWTARTLFQRFAAGEVMSTANGRTLGVVGNWLIASAVLALIETHIVLPMTGVEQVEPLMNADVMLLCIGIAIRLLGRVLGLAAEIKADSDAII